MVRRDRAVPHAVTADGPFLAAILDTLDDLYDLLDARLPVRVGGDAADPAEGGAVRLQEPDQSPTAGRLTEPERPGPADPQSPADVPEPVPAENPPPARAGRGSSLDAWRAFATAAGVAFTADDGRDDIIAACEAAGVLEQRS